MVGSPHPMCAAAVAAAVALQQRVQAHWLAAAALLSLQGPCLVTAAGPALQGLLRKAGGSPALCTRPVRSALQLAACLA